MAGSGLAAMDCMAAEANARGAPSRTLVVCCDGTWNDPEDQTNVWRTFVFLRDHCGVPPADPDPKTGSIAFASETTVDLPSGEEATVPIFAYYDKGVGEKRGGGAFGVGLGDNVRQAYAFVARNWRPRASIFIFGFSRGAYTARSLAGMLGAVGVVDAGDQSALDAAWAHYRLQPNERTRARKAIIDELQQPGARRGTVVRFLGVWDTVGSLGVPVPQLRFLSNKFFGSDYQFHDTALGRNVLNACQALAIHEKRGAFKPVLWTRCYDQVRDEEGNDCPQRLLQVWFTGSHGDVGGGYQGDRRLTDIALTWMLRRALESGHPLVEDAWNPHCEPDALGARNDSMTRTWRIAAGDRSVISNELVQKVPVVGDVLLALLKILEVPDAPRAIGGEITTDDGYYVVGLGERLHASVLQRYRGDHTPDNVKQALAAHIPVFHERKLLRRPCAPDTIVVINGNQATMVDRSNNGIGVADAPWLQDCDRCRLTLDGEIWEAHVAWNRGDRAGIALRYRQPQQSLVRLEAG